MTEPHPAMGTALPMRQHRQASSAPQKSAAPRFLHTALAHLLLLLFIQGHGLGAVAQHCEQLPGQQALLLRLRLAALALAPPAAAV
jgi:hypothetical protein